MNYIYMKSRTVVLIVTCVCSFLCISVSAQDKEASERYSKKYDQLVSVLGPAGVGIETVLDKWEASDPKNRKMLTARFNYYFTKSKTSSVVAKPGKKYLGNEPLFTLKDSTGNDIRYFEDVTYDDSLFSIALKNIDKAISVFRKDIGLRFNKAAALVAYEKESPDMALVSLEGLVDEFYASSDDWTFDGEIVDNEIFEGAIQEYCYTFFNIGTESSYNAFNALAEKMLTKNPASTMFLSDVGSPGGAVEVVGVEATSAVGHDDDEGEVTDIPFDASVPHPDGVVVGESVEEVEDGEGALSGLGDDGPGGDGLAEDLAFPVQFAEAHGGGGGC